MNTYAVRSLFPSQSSRSCPLARIERDTRVGLYKELLTQLEEMVAEGYAIQAYLRHKYYVIGPVLTDGHVRTVGEDTKVITAVDYDDLELTIFTVFMVRGPQVNEASVELTEAVLLLLRSFILDMSGTVGYGGRG